MEFKFLFLSAFVLGCQGLRISVSTTEDRGVFTPTCTLDLDQEPQGFSGTEVTPGFLAYYKEKEGDPLSKRGLMVCMKVGQAGAIDQCVIAKAVADESLPREGNCVAVEQKTVPQDAQKVGDKWMTATPAVEGFAAGRAFCAEKGGIMARPRSLKETEEITKFLGTKHVWIGANDLDNEGEWYFSNATHNSDEKVTWFNWNAGEPNNNYGNEHCVVLRANKGFRWNDAECPKTFPTLCEYPQ